ncbi:uncharacterized protein LOC144529220 [Sander vitreus]
MKSCFWGTPEHWCGIAQGAIDVYPRCSCLEQSEGLLVLLGKGDPLSAVGKRVQLPKALNIQRSSSDGSVARLNSCIYLILFPADVEQLSVVKEEVPPEQQECSSSVDQQEPEPPTHIKEEQEELWSSQEGEQLQGLEEADITKFPFTPVPVKIEDDEEKAQSSQLHQRQTQHMETEADGEDCGGPEPARNSHPLLQPETEDQTGDSSESETDDSADWKETREPQSALNSLKHDSRCKKTSSCFECGKRFGRKSDIKRHMKIHTGEKPFSCFVCGKAFSDNGHLKRHMKIHTGEKPFSCSVCNTSFTQSGHLRSHMAIVHTGEKYLPAVFVTKDLPGVLMSKHINVLFI